MNLTEYKEKLLKNQAFQIEYEKMKPEFALIQKSINEQLAVKNENVKNIEGAPETKVVVIHQNNIDYTPKVSVILPVYNTEKYLKDCLDTIVNQTLKEIEIICVDDGSTDNSLNILKEYASKDKRITLITQENLFAGVARNVGINLAKGEYLSFLDSDDFFELDMLEGMYNQGLKNNVDIVICKFTKYNELSKKFQKPEGINCNFKKENPIFSPNEKTDNLFNIAFTVAWNKIFKRNLILDNKIFFQSLITRNDTYFSCVAMVHANNIQLLDKSYYYYRYNRQNSLVNTSDKYPLTFYDSYTELYKYLKSNNLFDTYKKAFINKVVGSCIAELNLVHKEKETVLNCIKNQIVPEFELLGENKKYITQDNLKGLESILNGKIYKKYTFSEKIFSIKNLQTMDNKAYKVITILGLQMKIRNRKKEK